MQAENSEEFYDVSTRNKKYGRVDAMNGPVLLEKYAIAAVRLDESSPTNSNTGLLIPCKAQPRRTSSRRFRLDLASNKEIKAQA